MILKPRILTPHQRELFHKLTPLQKRVATGLLAGKERQQAYAAAKEGFTVGRVSTGKKADDIVRQLLTKPNVKAFMDSVEESIVTAAIMDREEALMRLSTLARANLGEMVEFKSAIMGYDKDDKPIVQTIWHVKDSALSDKDALSTISELSATSAGIKIKLHNPVAALTQLIAMEGWNKPAKLDITNSDGSMAPTLNIDATKLSSATLHELLEAQDNVTPESNE